MDIISKLHNIEASAVLETMKSYPEWEQRFARRVEDSNRVTSLYREKGEEVVEVVKISYLSRVLGGKPTFVVEVSGDIFSTEEKYPETIKLYKSLDVSYVKTENSESD